MRIFGLLAALFLLSAQCPPDRPHERLVHDPNADQCMPRPDVLECDAQGKCQPSMMCRKGFKRLCLTDKELADAEKGGQQ